MIPRLLIAARLAPTYAGGLAFYQRELARELDAAGLARTSFLSIDGGDDRHFDLPQNITFAHNPPHPWMSLASRPLLHPLLMALIRSAYTTEIRNLAKTSPDAVHFVGTGWDFLGFAAHSIARRANAPFSIWPAVHPGSWGDDAIDLRLYRLADHVFCQSRGEIEHLASRGLERSKAVLCGLPPMCLADGDGPRLRSALDIGSRPAVFFLGRRTPEKGYDALIRSWPLVMESHPDAVLIVSGTGDVGPLPELPPRCYRDLGIPDERVKADAYAACDIFCLPSAHESFGIVFAEAWSYGKPVICGPAPAPKEWIREDETGLGVDQSPGAIAAAIVALLSDPARRSRLGEAGRAFQRDTLTWKKIAAIHAAAFGFGGGR